jgi:site-specific recombinase XerD
MTINLKTVTARKRLQAYRDPHWMKLPAELIRGGAIGFRRSPDTGAESWHARVYADGAYHRTNLGPVTEHFQYKDAFKAALAWAQTEKEAGPAPTRAHTLDDVIQAYLSYLQGNSSQRDMDKRRQAEKRLDALIPERTRRRKVESIEANDVNTIQHDYRQRKNMKGEPISNDSVNRVMTHFIAAFNYGHRNDMVKTNKAWRGYKRLPEATLKRRSKEYIPIDQREAFLKACPEALRAICSAMNVLAARPSELRRLLVSDVKENSVKLLTYKGNGSVRLIPLGADSALKKLLDSQCTDKGQDDFVFTTESSKQWTQANLAKIHNRVRDEGKFNPAFESYVWRHCRITDWARKPYPAPEVAKLAGTSLEFIQKNYYESDDDIQTEMVGM